MAARGETEDVPASPLQPIGWFLSALLIDLDRHRFLLGFFRLRHPDFQDAVFE